VVQRAAENNFSLISEKDALSLKLIIKGKWLQEYLRSLHDNIVASFGKNN
jgi:hypothetical protein